MARLTLTLDSSQLATYYECEELWNLQYNKSLTLAPVSEPKYLKEDMEMGSYGHKLLEIYYNRKALSGSQSDCVEEALDTQISEELSLSPSGKEKVRTAFGWYWKIYSNDVEVALGNPIREIKFDENDTITEGWKLNPLVEKGFSYCLLDTPDYLFVLEGRIDLIYKAGDQPAFMDHKFQGREKSLYKKRIQFRNYSLVTGLNLGCYNYIRYHKTVEKNTFVREYASFSNFEREWWRKELIKKFIRIAHTVKTGEYEKNWNSCEGKYRQCIFTPICNERNEKVKLNIIEQHFKEKEKWSPW